MDFGQSLQCLLVRHQKLNILASLRHHAVHLLPPLNQIESRYFLNKLLYIVKYLLGSFIRAYIVGNGFESICSS